MAAVKADNRVIKYGIKWPNKPWGKGGRLIPCPDWYIELQCLQHYDKYKADLATFSPVSWPQHFVNFTTIVFGDPNGIFYFEWNPNSKRILKNFCKHDILSIGGHKSSGKTNVLALIGAMVRSAAARAATGFFFDILLKSPALCWACGRGDGAPGVKKT